MNNKNYFELLPERTREYLLRLAAQVTGVIPIETGTFCISTRQLNANIEQTAILNELATRIQKKYKYLYYIQLRIEREPGN